MVKTFPGPRPRGETTCRSACAPGGSLGLVGESGSGKTTLSRMICRLIDADGGDIIFQGESIGAHPVTRLSSLAAAARHPDRVPGPERQPEPALHRLRQHRPSAAPAGGPARRRHADARVQEAAARAGLPADLLGRFPHQLSGGQKARVGIARAIAPRPKLLVLDEPTAALDVSIQAVILQLLDRLRTEDDIALLFVSHDLNVVRMLCEEMVVLRKGRVVEAGASRAVFAASAGRLHARAAGRDPAFRSGRAAGGRRWTHEARRQGRRHHRRRVRHRPRLRAAVRAGGRADLPGGPRRPGGRERSRRRTADGGAAGVHRRRGRSPDAPRRTRRRRWRGSGGSTCC